MPDVLLEIGTEELPSSAVIRGEARLRTAAAAALENARLGRSGVESFATPRRLAVLLRDVPAHQAPAIEERRGPPVAKAYAPDGSLTAAAAGFAKANGVPPEALVRRRTEQGEYVFAVHEQSGAAMSDVLPATLAEAVRALDFPETMRWDASGIRFPRPIRWLVALIDGEVVPVRHGELVAGRSSRGHRVFHPGPLEIPDAGSYESVLLGAHVIASRDARREAVRKGVEEVAAELGGRAVVHEHVLDEVTDLVEEPTALVGRFDERFLELPREVLETAMESHQRYFPVESSTGQLEAGFVVVSNADAANAATIVAGNRRVLRARLEDAAFFFREDQKVSLATHAERLDGVVFHAQLGTLKDKSERVGRLVELFSDRAGLPEDVRRAAVLAASVYKADLVTHMVYEFPELQGVMGREYALRDRGLADRAGGDLRALARAIEEHYLPRAPGDALPSSAAGAVLGLADRLDTVVGYVGVGLAPTGSEDPYQLRRQAAGFAAISLTREERLPLRESVRAAYDAFVEGGAALGAATVTEEAVVALIRGRTEAILREEGIVRMFVEAAAGAAWTDLPDLAARARALRTLHGSGVLHSLAVAHERAYNLSKDRSDDAVEPEAFEHRAERGLHERLEEAAAEVEGLATNRDYVGALETLRPLAEALDTFFDRDRGVLVMAEDELVRRNRLALLKRTARTFGVVADFSVVIPAEVEKLQSTDDVEA